MKKSVIYILLVLITLIISACSTKKRNNTSILFALLSMNPEKIVQVEPGASRTSGVAPLSVHFTAGFSSSTAATRDFHNNDYTWDFGDTGSGVWGTTGKSKNRAKGPVAAHIFESSGTFTVNLTVRNGTTVIDTESFTIEVQDPDAVYGGTNTVCVSDAVSNDFSGCPAGARHIATGTLDEVMPYIQAGTRILFRRASSWTTGGLSFPDNAGPVTIGAYGTGTGQDALGIYGNAPLITVTGGTFCTITNKQDWRFTDLHLVNSGGTAGGIGGAYNMQRILFQRMRTEGFQDAIGWGHWNNDANLMTIDQMVISDSHIKDTYSNTAYIGGERLALLGSILENSLETHVVRIWQAYLGVISNNIISGGSINNANGRHALKLSGPGYSSFGNYNEYGTPQPGTGLLENRTRFAVVSDNIFGSSGPWPVMIAPQDTAYDAQLSDILFERNRIITNYGVKSPVNVSIALHATARYLTIRNNVFDGTGSGNDYTAISIISEGDQPTPLAVEVLNNTIYRSDNTTGNARYGIEIHQTAINTVLKNNLISFPNSAILTEAIVNSSSDLIQDGNLLTGTPVFIDPDNSNPLLTNFNLQPGSLPINAGVAVPVYEDMDGDTRPAGNYDIGAYEN